VCAHTGTALLECDDLSKIWCGEFQQRRKYAIRDILVGAPRHDRLRAHERFALRDFSVTVQAGENVVVLGLPASGKTTIARLVTQMSRPDHGSIRVTGRVGLVFSGRLGANPFLTLGEYVQLAASIHGAEPDVAQACCDEVLEMTGLSARRQDSLVSVQKGDLRYISLAMSLTVPQDLRVFDGLPNPGADPAGVRVATRVSEQFERGSNLILTKTTDGLPSSISRALIVHDGVTLYQGGGDTAVAIYEHFVYRMKRIRKVAEAAGAASHVSEAASSAQADPPSPATLIARATKSLDGPKVASLAEGQVAQAWASDRPIILGPFVSDVALELLYWRPFVAWMRATFGPRTAPVVAVSRGRVDAWYAGLVSEYVDVCDLLPFETYQTRNLKRIRDGGTAKQRVISDLDQELLDATARRLGTVDAEVIHPSVLFRVCSKIWSGAVPSDWLAKHARYQPFDSPSAAQSMDSVPGEPYVAASFWFNTCFPDSRRHRRVVNDVLSELSRRVAVVVVDAGSFPGVAPSIRTSDRIRVVALGPTEDQSREQAKLIAGACAFVGTFGGASLMAPFCNVPTSLVFGEPAGLFPHHVAVSHAVARAIQGPSFEVTKTADFDSARLGEWVDRTLQ